MLYYIDTSENIQEILNINFGYCKGAFMKKIQNLLWPTGCDKIH